MEHNNTPLITTSPAVLHEENEALKNRLRELVYELQNLKYQVACSEAKASGLHTHQGTAVTQDYYNELVQKAARISDKEAKSWIHREFGFDPAEVEILHEVSTADKNFTRPPIYAGYLKNYVRFLAGNADYAWEVADGVLVRYGI